jgi:hypothetical protein
MVKMKSLANMAEVMSYGWKFFYSSSGRWRVQPFAAYPLPSADIIVKFGLSVGPVMVKFLTGRTELK